jgi:hypothetical protein
MPVAEIASLVTDVLRARFFNAHHTYLDSAPIARVDGQSLRFSFSHGIDGGIWDLTLRLGAVTKTVRLHGRRIPGELLRLRELVESIGGPKAWQ